MKRHSQNGVALIVTLIMLAVVTFMAVTFLAVSRSERNAVTTTTDTASARLAADAALAQAEAQIMANILSTTNPYTFGLVVSTNYLPPTTGFPLEDLTNMFISPRAPVWLSNIVTHAMENRFYLDLNRNGVDDTNGYVVEVDNNNNIVGTNFDEVGDPEWIGGLERPDASHGPDNRFIYRYAFVAVPIGNALDLNAIYNQAIGRSVNSSAGTVQDGFMRNQGVGSWEINLAAFLADLNTNEWLPTLPPNNTYYSYNEPANANSGHAFEDALSLLSYRNDYNYNTLSPIGGNNPLGLFTNTTSFAPFQNNIDFYSDGPLMTNAAGINEGSQTIVLPWAGADNTNHFFNMQELFDPAKTAVGVTGSNFVQRLQQPGFNTSTYDRYTFYRLLSQLGTDSSAEQNKLNLNYRNVTNGVIVPGMETNFYPWSALEFFTNAADRMLRAYSQDWLDSNPSNYLATYFNTNGFGITNPPIISITNIPVYVNGQFVYSPAVNRVLQLAANIYDATTNNTTLGGNFPSVFRPTFNVMNQNGFDNVYINGYEQIVSAAQPDHPLAELPVDVTVLSSIALPPFSFETFTNVNVYGVPWIIGAKKGFPNFNNFSMQNIVGVTRRLEVTRPITNAANPNLISAEIANFQTNQMFTMIVSNLLGVECWNSYSNNYVPVSGNLNIVANDNLSLMLTITNDDGTTTEAPFSSQPSHSVTLTLWPGSGSAPWYAGEPTNASFDIPLVTNVAMPLNSSYPISTNWWQYSFNQKQFLTTPNSIDFETNINNNFLIPQFGLWITNNLQVFILDGNNVIDYVQLAGPITNIDINTNIFTDENASPVNSDTIGVWNTNLSASVGVPDGILNQIGISRSLLPLYSSLDGTWHSDPEATPLGGTIPQQQASFNAFFSPGNRTTQPVAATNLELSAEAPYAPTRYIDFYTTWQANDPLVHYLASDLNYTTETGTPHPGINVFNYGAVITNFSSFGQLNNNYRPWGGNPAIAAEQQNVGGDTNAYNMGIKDPLAVYSDNWNFPTYKLPTVGWLGRVHRGTPWQTVDLKSALPDINTWANWTGDLNAFDANNSSPGEDRQLFDLFSTELDDNATRGQLSVNVGAGDSSPQAGLAAWSALFSGVVVPTNATGGYTIIQPAGSAGVSSWLGELVTNINATRAAYTNVYGIPAFEHVGDILAAPFLTESNQWLLQNNSDTNAINDEMYEWIPQQTMSLLRVGNSPRYVIYCYGQALKPAQNGIVTSGNFFGMVTNYQVVSEIATRAVVRFNSERTNLVDFSTGVFPPPVTAVVTNNNAVIESFNVLPPD